MKQRVYTVLFLSVFVAMLGLGIVAPLMPIYAESLGATGLWLGVIFSGFSLSRVIFMPLVGKLSDRSGRKIFITAGLLVYAVVSILYTFAESVSSLVAVRFVHGLASSMVIPVAMAYVGELAENGQEGAAMGSLNAAMFLGMGAGPLFGGLLKDSFGFASAFYSMAALTCAAFLISLLFLPESGHHRLSARRTVPLRVSMRDRVMAGLVVFRVINAMGSGGVMAFLPIMADTLGVNSFEIGLLVSFVMFLTAALQRWCGRLADRYSRFWLVIAGSVVSSAALFLIPVSRNFAQLFLVSSLIGIGSGLAMPAASALSVIAGQRFGMGSTMGIFNSAMSVGLVVSPLVSGLVMDAAGIGPVFHVGAWIGLVGTLVFFVFLRGTEARDRRLPAE